jgi:hypothetical protein
LYSFQKYVTNVVYVTLSKNLKGDSMATSKRGGLEPDHAYVLARALLGHDGNMSVPRRERLGCAFVELRERIKEDFLKVAKDWQVSSEEVRRLYSEVYPAQGAGEPDLLCLEHACEGVMLDLRSSIRNYAEQYAVPDDLLETRVVDWLVSDHMGSERMPVRFLIPETEGSQGTAPTGPIGVEQARALPGSCDHRDGEG